MDQVAFIHMKQIFLVCAALLLSLICALNVNSQEIVVQELASQEIVVQELASQEIAAQEKTSSMNPTPYTPQRDTTLQHALDTALLNKGSDYIPRTRHLWRGRRCHEFRPGQTARPGLGLLRSRLNLPRFR